MGDMNFGVKWGCIDLEDLLLTLQFRAYVPTAANDLLGTRQVSLEPALLLNYHLTDYLTLEGEGRYWMPIGANQYNGNFVRYGVGLSYGQRDPSSVWLAPVIEGVGWTILNGHEQVPGEIPVGQLAGREHLQPIWRPSFRAGQSDQRLCRLRPFHHRRLLVQRRLALELRFFF